MGFKNLVKRLFCITRRPVFLALYAAVSFVMGLAAPASAAMVQQAAMTAADGAADNYFGGSAALSSDGNTALVGAGGKTVGGNANQGAVYVYVRSEGVWSQQTELTALDGSASNYFGSAVSVSSDGNSALIGAWGNNGNHGAAYVFVRTNNVWTQQQKLTASDGNFMDFFANSVSLSSDGNTVLIGANGSSSYRGAAYVFKRAGSVWTQQSKITASDAIANDQFGYHLSLSGDGGTALIGAESKTVGSNLCQGSAYIFKWNGSSWVQQQILTASDGAVNDQFGETLAMSGDGTVAVVGAWRKSVAVKAGQGVAYVFKWNGSSWVEQQILSASDGAADNGFGMSLSLSSNGWSILVDAWSANSNKGAAYLFQWNGASWVEQQILTASDGAAGDQGWYPGLSLSSDGTTAVFGTNMKYSGQGAAYFFVSEVGIYASVAYDTGGTISCSPNPVRAHSDAVCTMSPTQSFPNYYHVSDVQIALVSFPFLTSVEPTTRYTFDEITTSYYIQVTFASNNIRLYKSGVLQVDDYTIAGALADSAILDTDTIKVQYGAYAEPGGITCNDIGNVVPKLSGGWDTGTIRNSVAMSTVAGPFTIAGICSLIIDGITVE